MCDVTAWNALCERCQEVYEKYESSHSHHVEGRSSPGISRHSHAHEGEHGTIHGLYIVVETTTLCIRMVQAHL